MVATVRRSPGSLGKCHSVPLLGDERDCARYRRLLPYPQDRGSRVLSGSAAAENLPPLWRRRRRPSSDEPGRVTYQELVRISYVHCELAGASVDSRNRSRVSVSSSRRPSGFRNEHGRPVRYVRILSVSQVSAIPFSFSHCDSTIVPANTSTARSARGGLYDAMSDAAARRPVGRPCTRNTHGVSVNGRATMVSHI